MVGVKQPSRNKGVRGYPAYHAGSGSYIEALGWGRFIHFHNPSILHGSINGQAEFLKCFEKTQVVAEQVIRALLVGRVLTNVLEILPSLKKSWGSAYQQS
jgi:hypothetical protein